MNQPLNKPARDADGQADQDDQGRGHAHLVKVAEGTGRQPHHRADREVNLGVDDHEGHHQGEDDLFDGKLEQVDLVGDSKEIWR